MMQAQNLAVETKILVFAFSPLSCPYSVSRYPFGNDTCQLRICNRAGYPIQSLTCLSLSNMLNMAFLSSSFGKVETIPLLILLR